MSAETNPCKTLFVRNIPLNTTNEKLETVFGDVGPIKRCFVVKDKGADKCKGFGYVTYSVIEDATKAKEIIKSLDGRKLYVSYANPKEKKKKKHKDPLDTENMETSHSPPSKSVVSKEVDSKPSSGDKVKSDGKSTGGKVRAACTVVVTGLPPDTTWNDVHILAKNVKNLSEVVYPVPGREQPTAYIRTKSKKSALKAVKKLPSCKLKGLNVKAVLLSQESTLKSPKYLKKCRLIIRNLSFKCREDDLKQTFGKFGELSEVVIPRKPGGKLRGFGIVQFCQLADAGRAIKEVNKTPIKGRPVAVDWAVPKDKYLEVVGDESDDEGSFSADSTDSGGGSVKHIKGKQDDTESDSENDEEDSGDASESEEDDNSDTDGSGEGNDEDDEDEGFSDDSDIEDDNKKVKKQKSPQKSDVDQGKTLFIRNLAFDSQEEDLEDCFAKFGEVGYARVVIDPQTERSRGTAFVQFKNKDDVEKCLKAADSDSKDGGITLDGRKLNVTIALERSKAEELRKEKVSKDPKDKRNLWLAREGLIRPGTQAAEGLSASDLAKRAKVEQAKHQKLKDPRIFISTTRLCVRNIPVKVDDIQLRKIFMKAVGDKSAVITESRVMRDLSQVNAKGVGKSKGYGFVDFNEHKHALQALRNTNNNPDIFGESKRLIVEFSLENRLALQTKQRRQERNLAKQDKIKRMKGERVKERRKSKQKADIAQLDPSITSDMKKGPKGLPSHWGPKIRHKARQAKAGKKQRDKLSRKEASDNKRKRIEDSVLPQPSKKKKVPTATLR